MSTTSVVTFSNRSSASAFFTSTPSCAPRPTPTMMDMGVARPRAHGQAMMRTATALTMACASFGSGPSHIQTTEGEHRNSQHHRHEDARDLVGETLNGRAAALGFGNHVHDLPEQRVAADSLGAHDETAGAIDGAARHFVADGLFHRERFAGDHGLFHAGVTFDHRAIHGHLVTWNHAQPVADFHLVERDFMIAPRCDLSRRGRCEIQQRFDGAARAAAGAEFEHLAEEHQHNDHRCGFKVDGNLALVLHRVLGICRA